MAKTPKLPIKPPEPKKDREIKEVATNQYQSTETLIYRQEFERAIKFVEDRVGNTNFIMGVIIVILFIGFLTLLFSLFAIFGQYIGFKNNSDMQVINSINELRQQINNNQLNLNLPQENKIASPSGQ